MHQTTCPPAQHPIGARCPTSRPRHDPDDFASYQNTLLTLLPDGEQRRVLYQVAIAMLGLVALSVGLSVLSVLASDRQLIIIDEHGPRAVEVVSFDMSMCEVDEVDHAWVVFYPGALSMWVSRSMSTQRYYYPHLSDINYGWESMACSR